MFNFAALCTVYTARQTKILFFPREFAIHNSKKPIDLIVSLRYLVTDCLFSMLSHLLF